MTPAAPHGSGLVHDAFFHDDENALVGAAVPFVRDGVERGETVFVNTAGHPVTALLKAMFGSEPNVEFGEGEAYRKPVSTIDAYKRTMDRDLGRGVPAFRAVGHIDFAANPLPWREWLRYEAVVNHALADYPLRTLCPFHVGYLDQEIIAAAERAHPTIVEGTGRRVANPAYVPPAELVTRPELKAPRDPLQEGPAQLEIDPVTDLRALRLDLYPPTIFTALPRKKVDDFVKAVVEVAANGCAHGVEPVRVRLWTSPDRLVATVTDQGSGIDDPLKGYVRNTGPPGSPSAATHDGLGLWAARELCDILDFAHTDAGFTVRLVSFGS